jgi:hypothetical protein
VAPRLGPAGRRIGAPRIPIGFGTIVTANSDVLGRKPETKKMLIIDFAEPLSYTTFCRIIFGLNQSAYEA